MVFRLVGQPAAADDVPAPEAAVLDEHPVVDPARGRIERLCVRMRYVGAKGAPGD